MNPADGFRKNVAQKPKAKNHTMTVREAVIKHGDLWWCFMDSAFSKSATASSSHDRYDASLMELMEKGISPRVEVPVE